MMLFLALIPGGLTEEAGGFGCVPHLTASWDIGTVVASGKQEKINTGIVAVHLHSHFDSAQVPFSFSLLFLNATAEEHHNLVCAGKKEKTKDGLSSIFYICISAKVGDTSEFFTLTKGVYKI